MVQITIKGQLGFYDTADSVICSKIWIEIGDISISVFHSITSLKEILFDLEILKANTLTENSPVSGASLKKAEIFFGYFDSIKSKVPYSLDS